MHSIQRRHICQETTHDATSLRLQTMVYAAELVLGGSRGRHVAKILRETDVQILVDNY